MNKLTAITLSLALGAGLVACGKQGEAPKTEEKAAMADDTGTMAAPAETKHGKGTATVTAIDTAKGQVTLDHGAIAEVETLLARGLDPDLPVMRALGLYREEAFGENGGQQPLL